MSNKKAGDDVMNRAKSSESIISPPQIENSTFKFTNSTTYEVLTKSLLRHAHWVNGLILILDNSFWDFVICKIR